MKLFIYIVSSLMVLSSQSVLANEMCKDIFGKKVSHFYLGLIPLTGAEAVFDFSELPKKFTFSANYGGTMTETFDFTDLSTSRKTESNLILMRKASDFKLTYAKIQQCSNPKGLYIAKTSMTARFIEEQSVDYNGNLPVIDQTLAKCAMAVLERFEVDVCNSKNQPPALPAQAQQVEAQPAQSAKK